MSNEEAAYAHGWHAREAEIASLKAQVDAAVLAIGPKMFLPGYTFQQAMKRRLRLQFWSQWLVDVIVAGAIGYWFFSEYRDLYERCARCLCIGRK